MRSFILFITIVGLSACASMPGYISTTESKVDGTSEISMNPGWIPGSTIKLGLFKKSNMQPDEVLMIVQTSSDIIATKDGLSINIDGQKQTFSSVDKLADIQTGQYGNAYTKRFKMSLAYVKQMMEGKSVWVKVSYNGPSYTEGDFTIEQPSSAKRGFKNFLATIDGPNVRTPAADGTKK